MNRIIVSRHSEKEWTSWSKCENGIQERERAIPGLDPELGKEFETKFCSKGFSTPQPKVDVGSFEDYEAEQLNQTVVSRNSEKEWKANKNIS